MNHQDAFALLQSPRNTTPTLKFFIEKYLTRTSSNTGRCKHCDAAIPWARDRIVTHKNGPRCKDREGTSIGDEEALFFKKQSLLRKEGKFKRPAPSELDADGGSKRPCINGFESADVPKQPGLVHAEVPRWADKISVGACDRISGKIANLAYRTGVPIGIFDSAAWHDLLAELRPAYAPYAPTARQIRGSMLTDAYDGLFTKLKSYLATATSFVLVSDGWSNHQGQHFVCYVVQVPGRKPFFYKTMSTVGVRQTGVEIANKILEVVEEIGASKCVAVITDNASNMRTAWDVIEDKYPHIYASGCAAHVMNLLVKDVCSIDEFKATLDKAVLLVKFVNDHQHVRALFDVKRRQFRVSRCLSLAAPTRWYTQYHCVSSVKQAKFALLPLLEDEGEEVLSSIQNQSAVENFRETLKSQKFWHDLGDLVNVLEFPSNIIGKFENDSSDLAIVYDYFNRLRKSWKESTKWVLSEATIKRLTEITEERWNFLHTSSMGFAFFLTPKRRAETWAAKDKIQTKKEFLKYITVFFKDEPEKEKKCKAELKLYMTMRSYQPAHVMAEYEELSGRDFWSMYGCDEFPTLAEIAMRAFVVPTSSAAAERVWSIYSFIWTARRNRLTSDKVEKLAFMYINSSLLDVVDTKEYLQQLLDDAGAEDEEE